MAKQYECCMIYENRRGNPAREKIAELRNRKTVKNIYPSDKADIGKTPETVLNNSKNYAVFLTENDDFDPTRGFCQNIIKAASLTKDNRKKKILYTILDGNQDADAVLNVKDMLKDVPQKRKIYLKNYDPETMEKYILLSETPAVKIIVLFILVISVLLMLIGLPIVCNYNIGFIQKIVSWGSYLYSHSIGVLVDFLDRLNVIHDSNDVISANAPITGVILATPIPVIWFALWRREARSVNPLFWLNFRRYITLFILLFYSFCYKSADIDTSKVADSNITLDFERIVATDLYGQSDNILVPINDFLEPSGKLWIEENGNDLLVSEVDKPFRQHLKECPPLREGNAYTIRWESDSIKAGKKEFHHHKGESVVVEIEPTLEYSDFESITKAQLREYADFYNVEFSEEFKMYSENGFRTSDMDIEDAGEFERIFTADIAIVCFKLKDKHKECTFVFGLDPNNYTEIQEVPSGHVPVTIEFQD